MFPPIRCWPEWNYRLGGGYELISGHRRKMGAELAGLTEIPIIVRNLNDDEADIIMVDSNIQREDLLFSEKAFAYKIKLEALKHQGKKGTEITTKQIGKNDKISGRTIQRKEDDLEYLLDLTNYYLKIYELLYNKHHRIEYLIIISGYLEQIVNESIFYVAEVVLR